MNKLVLLILFGVSFVIVILYLKISKSKEHYVDHKHEHKHINVHESKETDLENVREYKYQERKYFVSTPKNIEENKKYPVLLLFHGGGSEADDSNLSYAYQPKDNEKVGILNYTKLYEADCVTIAFQGQQSNNIFSWISAFPWMKANPQNDVDFVETVLDDILKSDFSKKHINDKIFAAGKSDGGEFCLYLNNNSKKIKLNGIAMISAAHFTLNNENEFISKYLLNSDNKIGIDTISMHGTKDQVMPFNGKHFTNRKAIEDSLKEKESYWKTIDSNVQENPLNSNTYTVNIPNFWNSITDNMEIQITKKFGIDNKSELKKYTDTNNTRFYSIEVTDQNHCWSGHENSGPESSLEPNKQFDATAAICSFFNISLNKSYSNSFLSKTENLI